MTFTIFIKYSYFCNITNVKKAEYYHASQDRVY